MTLTKRFNTFKKPLVTSSSSDAFFERNTWPHDLPEESPRCRNQCRGEGVVQVGTEMLFAKCKGAGCNEYKERSGSACSFDTADCRRH